LKKYWEVNVTALIKDMAMFELSMEVIVLIIILIVLAIVSLIPDDIWVKYNKSDWFDEFLHPKH